MSAPEYDALEQAGGRGPATAAFPGDARLRFGVLVGVLLAMLWAYRDTAESMVAIWARSDTFAHGYLIAPISLWLIWRQREQLRGIPFRHSLLGLLALAAAGFAWLLGELASVAAVSQFALVGMIIALVWAVTGTQMARALAFPLGFLFFLVPVGEFLFPWMMDRTTDFVIWGLRGSGVPVYAEGRNLVIPSGHWAVVEGCSGVRYLIASVVVGSLYAYLTYRSLARRLLFVAVSVVLPVFANWLRAYGIVMLAHLSDNRIAAGVDHLVYGWVFFGAVMLVLFWVGGRWREDLKPRVPPSRDFVAAPIPSRSRFSVRAAAWLGVTLVAVLAWKPIFGWLGAQDEHGHVALSPVPHSAEWVPIDLERLPAWTPLYAGTSAEMRAGWARAGQPVWVYIGYYRDQAPGAELINSENRVAKSKDPVWRIGPTGWSEAPLGEEAVKARSTELFSDEQRLLIWQWYWLGGRWTTNDYLAKAYLVLARLTGSGDDSAVVMFYAPFAKGELAAAERRLENFTRAMGPGIARTLSETMGR